MLAPWRKSYDKCSCCFSFTQSCPTLFNTIDCSTPVLSVPHHLPKFPKFMSIALVMPSNHLILWLPLLLPFVLSQQQGLFEWGSCSHQMTKILAFQLQYQSFQGVFRVDFPYDWLVWSPWCPRDSQESSPAPQFEAINSMLCIFKV